MRAFFLGLLVLLTLPATGQSQRPNIVLILADDLGVGDLGAYGQATIRTPHLDQLAAEGLRFTQFYAGTTVCAPSRSALVTGQHTGHTYIRGNKEIGAEGQAPLADSVVTMAMVLKQAGYITGAFGKWGLGMPGTTGDPNLKGFDEFFGYNCQRQSHRYYPTHLWHNQVKVELEGNGLQAKTTYAPELIHEKSLEFIERNRNQPFFLFIPTVLPHAELAGPSDRFYKEYENQFQEKPYGGDDYGPLATAAGYSSVEQPKATYAAMVARLDFYVGQVVDKLEALGLLNNTLILFSSDNGAHAEGGAHPSYFNSTAGLRGQKRDLYEGGLRVPLLAHWPAVIKAGKTSTHVGALWDILPTLADVAGAKVPSQVDGISLLPTLQNKGKQARHRYLYWEFHEQGGKQAVRAGNWKLVRLNVKGTPTDELYHLKKGEEKLHWRRSVYRRLKTYLSVAHTPSVLFPLMDTGPSAMHQER